MAGRFFESSREPSISNAIGLGVVVVGTELSGKEPHRQVSIGLLIVSTLA